MYSGHNIVHLTENVLLKSLMNIMSNFIVPRGGQHSYQNYDASYEFWETLVML